MAFATEFMGHSIMETTSCSSSKGVLQGRRKSQFLITSSPFVALKRVSLRKRAVVAAISEEFLVRQSVASSLGSDLDQLTRELRPTKFKVRAVLTVRNRNKEALGEAFARHVDALADKLGRNVALELVSSEIDPKSKGPRKSKETVIKDWSEKSDPKSERVNYTADFVVDSNFGIPGAITVANKHRSEFFLETITIEGFACGPVHFPCNSWVQSKKDHPEKRIFFSNKPYLPNETPAGLRALREKELKQLRGDGKGARKLSDRVYDYEVYNDLGNPDQGIDLARPILGGPERPYPRRCRTGRAPTDTDLKSESRVEKPLPMYVPRDEQFEEAKQDTFSFGRLKAVLHNLIPSLKAGFSEDNQEFDGFSDIDSLYSDGVLRELGLEEDLLKKLPMPNLVKMLQDNKGIFKYDTPKIVSKDKYAWLRDDEFARQAIAGVNPVTIEKMEVFPPVSKLDPEIYGPLESALKEDDIIGQINGMTVEQALNENKLFMVDYHDAYLPFLDQINALDGRKAYATRTIYFLTAQGTLKPIAIELSLPLTGPVSRAKRVVTPPVDATTNWKWQLAKAHVCSNDAGVHQLVNHWLRTHACMEPFVLAAHRQLSAMHPIFKLLDPHMRYTMEINGLARQNLINADGVIEACFTPGRYCMEMSAAAYKSFWRFDKEGLPADLIRRGMAVPDASQPHGLRLLIEDYPYANDGLLIWAAIEDWVKAYVDRYYSNPSQVRNDRELQSWYSESINVGHADIRDAEWWPALDTPEDLASILTTLIWLASAQHAALNFGQYPYGGYVPNRPPLMRRLIPEEGDPEHACFLRDPQRYFLSALPSVLQATKFMAVVDTLSTHSPDEEYLGERNHPSTWSGDAEVVEAFYAFAAEVGRIEKEIDRRNADPSRKSRCGAGVLPYELLAPSSEPGVTCRGVPNSVSI